MLRILCFLTSPKKKGPGTVAKLSLESSDRPLTTEDDSGLAAKGGEAEQEGYAAMEASTGPHVKGQTLTQ